MTPTRLLIVCLLISFLKPPRKEDCQKLIQRLTTSDRRLTMQIFQVKFKGPSNGNYNFTLKFRILFSTNQHGKYTCISVLRNWPFVFVILQCTFIKIKLKISLLHISYMTPINIDTTIRY